MKKEKIVQDLNDLLFHYPPQQAVPHSVSGAALPSYSVWKDRQRI